MSSVKRKSDETSRITKRFCVTRLRFDEKKGSLAWKIRGFNICQNENAQIFESTKFRITGCNLDWSVKLNTKARKYRSEDYISLTVQSSGAYSRFIHGEFSIVNASSQKSNIVTLAWYHYKALEVPKFVSWTTLMNQAGQLLPRGELTISCVLTTEKKLETVHDVGLRWPPEDVVQTSPSNLSTDLGTLFDEGKSTDVVLWVGDKKIQAHKTLLACRSPVFASMFEHDMQERNSNEVVITDVDSDVFTELVRFMYTGKMLSFDDLDFALKLLVAADKYDVKQLKTRCVQYLRANVSEENVLEILVVADACSESLLSSECMDIVVDELSSVTLLHEWISKLKTCPELLSVIDRLLGDMQQSR